MELRGRLLEEPAVVAVELPGGLEQVYRTRRRSAARDVRHPLPRSRRRRSAAVYVPVEPADPFTEAVRTALEIGAEVALHRTRSRRPPSPPRRLPRSLRAPPHRPSTSYIESYRVYPQPRNEETAAHAAGMAWKLQGADPEADVFVVVSLNLTDPLLDAMEVPQDPPKRQPLEGVRLLNPHPDCLVEITVEYPYLQYRYEFFRIGHARCPARRPAPRAVRTAARGRSEVRREHRREARPLAPPPARAVLAQPRPDLRRPDLAAPFDLTVAARSIVDDNYGWEVWETAGQYPAQHETSELETVNISGEEIWLNTRGSRSRRRLPRPKQRLKPTGLKARKKEKFAGEWAQQTDGNAICSYPPEDLVIENYGRFLKNKARASVVGRASPRRALHHLDARRHRPARDHPQLA